MRNRGGGEEAVEVECSEVAHLSKCSILCTALKGCMVSRREIC